MADSPTIPTIPTDASPEPSDQDEFDAALAEISEADSPAVAAEDLPPADTPVEGAADQSAPAPAAATETPAAAPAPAGEPQDDIWASATQAQREAFESLQAASEQRARSLIGRQSALDRELAQLRQQVNQGQHGQQEQSQDGPAAEDAQAARAATIKQLREDYPEVAGPILDMLADQNAEIARLSQPVATFQQQQASSAEQQQREYLTQLAPDWEQYAATPELESWLATKPQAIREAFDRNRASIVDGADAALVVNLFKAETGKAAAAATPAPAPTPTPAPALDDRRQRQLANGRDGGRSSPAVTSFGPDKDDFDGGLDDFLSRQTAEVTAHR